MPLHYRDAFPTRKDALKNIKEAIETYLETVIDEVVEYNGEVVTISV